MELIAKIRAEIERLKEENNNIKCKYNEKYCIGYDDAFNDLLSFLGTLESEKPIEQEGFDKKAPRYPLSVVADLLGSTPQPPIILQQKSEKPMNLDLEIEIEDYVEQRWRFAEDLNAAVPIYLYDMTLNELKDCASHFAKWGAEHAKIDVTDFCKPIDPGIAQCIADHSWEMLGEDEKPVPNDLEEAADKHIREVVDAAGHPSWEWETRDIKDAFIAGAEWQKEQMMKDGNVILAEEDFDAEKEKSMEWGYNLCKKQMLKEAEEYEVGMHGEPIKITFDKYVQRARGIFPGDKVRIIILKEDMK